MLCRIDKSLCEIFLDFGRMPIANGFIEKKNFKKEYFFPLKVAFSKKLSLFQLVKNPNPKKMFNKHYPFYTSSSKKMTEHFDKLARWLKRKYVSQNSLILEVGSNDGTLLKNFKKENCIGFEPSKSVHKVAKSGGLNSINKFFNLKNISFLKKNFGKFDLITGANVFCHIPNQINLIKCINKLLCKKGSIIFEEPYLGSMYKKTSYDQIYDEHIFMFSLTSIQKIYKLFNFELVDAIPLNTHGGSMRYIIKRKNISKKSKRLINLLKLEKIKKINRYEGCIDFKKKVEKSKLLLIKKILKMKKRNEKICGYGATSKSTTILNYCNINNKMIDCIFDTTKDKIGKYTPGTHIPIVNHKCFKNSKYEHVFLFAWNHKKEILKKEKKLKNVKWFTHLS